MSISPQHRADVEAMFRAFAPDRCERWCGLLAAAKPRWDRISPIDVWPLDDQSASSPELRLDEMLSRPPLVAHLDSMSLVLRCGHSSNPGVSEWRLRDVFPEGRWDYNIIFEGFVSIRPGKLAMALNHEGGICVLVA